jgi:FkbM family methyltransferase
MQQTTLRNFQVWYENGEEFHRLKREIFTQHNYFFESATDSPIIVDVGAHIGLATLYFKSIYPQAIITAIEPLWENFNLLSRNILDNRLVGVEAHQFACGKEDGERDFFIDETDERWYSSASFLPHAWNNQQQTKKITITVRKLSSMLPPHVDLLKIDAEGAEEEILLELGDKLRQVKRVIFEFHPAYGKNPQKIEQLLQTKGFWVRFMQNDKEVSWKRAKGLLIGEAVR